ncbi:hypothetical protein [Pedobacter sp. BS3]|nr:hypothetical protein [Pedobacter sp. BS3]
MYFSFEKQGRYRLGTDSPVLRSYGTTAPNTFPRGINHKAGIRSTRV